MIPPVYYPKEVKGSGFGRINILEALKASEQVRTSAAAAK
ncbi:hypothetical protein DFQ01_107155 [Paenibacillus cellulosilyticus]|uniref:Uncharacterized protein n=1 Tax=Paenibacillus cellulosilyticus TaxID=375489 RepID=A0A2V2YUJ6_9BACL|nr:hypothetical protein DFQ01_107155 [Paenibacillus cellulosilyticus]